MNVTCAAVQRTRLLAALGLWVQEERPLLVRRVRIFRGLAAAKKGGARSQKSAKRRDIDIFHFPLMVISRELRITGATGVICHSQPVNNSILLTTRLAIQCTRGKDTH